MNRTVTAIVVLAVLAVAALPSLHLEPIERLRRSAQQADMRQKFESLSLPSKTRLLAISEAPLPATTYFYASPWNGEYLCDELLEAARKVGEPKPWESPLKDRCGFSMRVAAGWRARLTGVFSYELRAIALPETRPGLEPNEEICVREREDDPPMETRLAPCWLGPDESYLYVTLFGEQVWIESEVPKDAV
jgi:hypothetical protein